MYEGGVRIPLMVVGPGIAHGRTRDLIPATALASMLCGYMGIPSHPSWETSMEVFVHTFSPNGLPYAPIAWRKAVIEERWKRIRRDTGVLEELFDLATDPLEATNLLLAPLSMEAYEANQRLEAKLDELP